VLFATGFLPVYKIANFNTTQNPDSYAYIRMADELESLSLPKTHYPLGYPLLILVERQVGSMVAPDLDPLRLMIVSSCVFLGLSTVFFFVATGYLLGNAFGRLVLTILFCYHPVVMFSSANALAESSGLALLLLFVVMLFRAADNCSLVSTAGAGLIASLVGLVRINFGLASIGTFYVYLIYLVVKKKGLSTLKPTAFLACAASPVVFLLDLGRIILANKMDAGYFSYADFSPQLWRTFLESVISWGPISMIVAGAVGLSLGWKRPKIRLLLCGCYFT
jgi:hypothetical protein